MPPARLVRIACAFLIGVVATVHAQERVHVAAASDLVYCLDALQVAFEQRHPGIDLIVTTGSSGSFHAQIRHGAPYDVFLSADVEYPRELIAHGLAEESTLQVYAIGRLVLWTNNPRLPLTTGVAILNDPVAVRRLTLANPAHAPYGRAAKEALIRSGLWDSAQPRLLIGDNVTQAAQFVQTGHADAGLVALALAISPALRGQGRYVLIPDSLHAPLEQAAVLTARGAANPAARLYLGFLGSPEARAIFDTFGFRLPAVAAP